MSRRTTNGLLAPTIVFALALLEPGTARAQSSCRTGGNCFSGTSTSNSVFDAHFLDEGSGGGAVWGEAWSGIGTIGSSLSFPNLPQSLPSGSIGVYGVSDNNSGFGVFGSSNGDGVHGTSGGTNGHAGVRGDATASGGLGVLGTGFGIGVEGSSNGGTGVSGTATGSGSIGVSGTASSLGVSGTATSTSGEGVQGVGFDGVWGQSTSGTGNGVEGYNPFGGNGVYGTTTGGASGVYGENNGTGYGVAGRVTLGNNVGTAIYGDNTSPSGLAGHFTGTVSIDTCLKIPNWGTAGTCSSDARLKKNIQPLVGSLDKISGLRPVTFEWRNPDAPQADHGTQIGFIAQDVEKVLPEWVSTNSEGFKTVSRKGLDVMLVESVQTLKRENDDLRGRVKALESGRRPLISGVGEGGIGLGMLGLACAVLVTRRKRSELDWKG
jgi:hypothetical protein